MYEEPAIKRCVAFVDGANTRLGARKAFGDALMNINPLAMIQAVCDLEGWQLAGAYYYLGVPDVRMTEDGYYAWMKRCARWRRQGVRVFTRTLLQDETGAAREKGIDIRLALDAVDLYRRAPFDVAVLFSQDQDFSELAAELKTLAREQGRWIEIVSAFPWNDKLPHTQGISGTRPLVLTESVVREALDTAENRALRFAIPTPAEDSPTPEIVPAFLPEPIETAPAIDEPLPASTFPVAIKRTQSRHAPLWLSAASALYLALGGATFALLAIKNEKAFTDPHASLEMRLTEVTQAMAQAALWPLYWSQHENLDQLALEAATRASTFQLPLWHPSED